MKSNLILTAALTALLAGCAAGGGTTKGDTAQAAPAAAKGGSLEARAQERWRLLIAGRADQAYDFFSPGYREVKSREDFAGEIAVRPVKWTQAVVESKDCPDGLQVCDVTIMIHYSVQSTLPGVGTLESRSPVIERWIETDGNWYFVPKEVARSDRGLR